MSIVSKISIHLILWEIIFISVATGHNISANHLVRRKREVAPGILNIRYYHNDQVELVILEKVVSTIPSFLVPIWNILGDQEESDNYLIEDIETVCYHGVQSFSAVTYFPHTNTLHGVIDHRFYIDGLPLSSINDSNLASAFIHPMADNTGFRVPNILNRKKRMDSKRKHPDDIESSSEKKMKFDEKLDAPRSILYAEILLVIDTLERVDATLEHKFEKVIMYALSYWNAVDMLFRHLKRTDMRINIAGIFVGETEDVVDHIMVSRSRYYVDENSRVFIPREVALDRLGGEYYDHGHGLERDSFDFLIWMTRATLTTGSHMVNDGGSSLGIAAPATDCGGTRAREREMRRILNRAIVMHDDKYADYQTAARELAHMMFASDDDVAISHGLHVGRNCLVSDRIALSSGIMDPTNKRVDGCLMWSFCSEFYFEQYARSKSSCCLLNFPYRTCGAPPLPVEELTVQRQCQCYGLQPFERQDCIASGVNQNHFHHPFCTSPLQCKTVNGVFVNVGLPLDGTPCLDDAEPGICKQREYYHRECFGRVLERVRNKNRSMQCVTDASITPRYIYFQTLMQLLVFAIPLRAE